MIRLAVSVVCFFVCSLAAQVVASDQEGKSKRGSVVESDSKAADNKRSARQKARTTLSNELEQNVLKMVQLHLPEIKTLLDRLKKSDPDQYAVAIRDLSKSVKRLQAAERRGPEALEIEVAIIQAQSSINLLIVRLKLRDNKKDRDALLRATKKLESAELSRLDFDVRQLKSRMKRMQELLDAAEDRYDKKQSSLEKQIDADYRNYLRKAGQSDPR